MGYYVKSGHSRSNGGESQKLGAWNPIPLGWGDSWFHRNTPPQRFIISTSSLLLYSRILTSSLCVSIHLSSAFHLSATKPSSFAKSCSIWILLLPLVGLPFIPPSIISCTSPSCLKTWRIHRCFLCQIRVQYLPVFVYSPENFLISNFIKPAIFSILLHIYISKASNLLLSAWITVH